MIGTQGSVLQHNGTRSSCFKERIGAALSENVLDAKAFLKRKGKWLTANELARYGINEIFKKSPL